MVPEGPVQAPRNRRVHAPGQLARKVPDAGRTGENELVQRLNEGVFSQPTEQKVPKHFPRLIVEGDLRERRPAVARQRPGAVYIPAG